MCIAVERLECPHYTGPIAAVDYKRDKVYEGPGMCTLVDKWCLLEGDNHCDIYEEFLIEEAIEEIQNRCEQ
jgi:hypothetical protein